MIIFYENDIHYLKDNFSIFQQHNKIVINNAGNYVFINCNYYSVVFEILEYIKDEFIKDHDCTINITELIKELVMKESLRESEIIDKAITRKKEEEQYQKEQKKNNKWYRRVFK